MIITLFGSGNLDREVNELAYGIGKRIANSGHILKNGGYNGTMKSSAKGCKDHGGVSIGVCVEGHLFATEGKPNEYLTEVIITKNLRERISELLICDKVIVLPGQIGTLEEMFACWAEMSVQGSGEMYMIGEKYGKLVDFLDSNGFINEGRRKYVRVVESVNDIDFLRY